MMTEQQKQFYTELGDRVRQERVRRGLSQADLSAAMRAAGARTGQTALSRIEMGNRKVKLVEVVALADLFNMTTDALLPLIGEQR